MILSLLSVKASVRRDYNLHTAEPRMLVMIHSFWLTNEYFLWGSGNSVKIPESLAPHRVIKMESNEFRDKSGHVQRLRGKAKKNSSSIFLVRVCLWFGSCLEINLQIRPFRKWFGTMQTFGVHWGCITWRPFSVSLLVFSYIFFK